MLPELIENMYKNESIYDFQTNYRDFQIFVIDNFDFSQMLPNETDYIFDNFDLNSERRGNMIKVVENKNECGIFQVKNRGLNLFNFVYYKYSPYEHVIEIENDTEFRSNVSTIAIEFSRNKISIEEAVAKIKNLTAQNHCWNIVFRTHISKRPEFYNCSNDTIMSRNEFSHKLGETRICFMSQSYHRSISKEANNYTVEDFSHHQNNLDGNSLYVTKSKSKHNNDMYLRQYISKSSEIKSSLRLITFVLILCSFFVI